MLKFKKETIEQKVLSELICDRCNKSISLSDDFREFQESYSIRFTGGYTSVFGDMNNISCDLCQECLKDLIGEYCNYNVEE